MWGQGGREREGERESERDRRRERAREREREREREFRSLCVGQKETERAKEVARNRKRHCSVLQCDAERRSVLQHVARETVYLESYIT